MSQSPVFEDNVGADRALTTLSVLISVAQSGRLREKVKRSAVSYAPALSAVFTRGEDGRGATSSAQAERQNLAPRWTGSADRRRPTSAPRDASATNPVLRLL